MKNHKTQKSTAAVKDPKIGRTVLNDLKRGDFKRNLRQDFQDLYHFYLDEEKRSRLEQMGRFRRYIRIFFWLLKSLVLKLSTGRRILLFIAVFLSIAKTEIVVAGYNDAQATINLQSLGFLILLLILALELKDKLLAYDELAIGRKVQFALMPQENPKLPGWDIWLFTRPANEVGGDLVDYFFINEKRLSLALGDVVGKGLGAALLTAKLQATLQALAPLSSSYTDLGNQLNTVFCRVDLANRFVSLIYLELVPDTDEINLLNAGHLPPLILRRSAVEELPHGAPALGIHAKAAYKTHHIHLHPGDLMLIYSDGLTEARNEAGTFFGEQRLINLLPQYQDLPTEKIGKKLVSAVEHFIGDARQNDDLSLVVIRRITAA